MRFAHANALLVEALFPENRAGVRGVGDGVVVIGPQGIDLRMGSVRISGLLLPRTVLPYPLERR